MNVINNLLCYKNNTYYDIGFLELRDSEKAYRRRRKKKFKRRFRKKKSRNYFRRYKYIFMWLYNLFFEKTMFFQKNYFKYSFFSFNFIYKYKSKRKFFLQNEMWSFYFHDAPANVIILHFVGFKKCFFFQKNELVTPYITFLIFEKICNYSEFSWLNNFLDEYTKFFKKVESSKSPFLSDNSIDCLESFFFKKNLYFTIDYYKLLIYFFLK